jgi:hypothetical protein
VKSSRRADLFPRNAQQFPGAGARLLYLPSLSAIGWRGRVVDDRTEQRLQSLWFSTSQFKAGAGEAACIAFSIAIGSWVIKTSVLRLTTGGPETRLTADIRDAARMAAIVGESQQGMTMRSPDLYGQFVD